MDTNVLVLLLNVVIMGFTAWFSFRRVRSQNSLDGSQQELNYRALYLGSQEDMRKMDEKIAKLEELVGRSHLEIALEIEMGKPPIVKSFQWLRHEEITKTP